MEIGDAFICNCKQATEATVSAKFGSATASQIHNTYKATSLIGYRTMSASPMASRSIAVGFILAAACLHGGESFCPSRSSSSLARPQRTSPSPSPLVAMTWQQQQQIHTNIIYQQNRQASDRSATRPLYNTASSSSSSDDESTRSKLRQLTGFSLTALRATLRAATGISLSQTISGFFRRVLGIMTPGMRYFLQPLLILYYAPMLMIRYWMVGPSQEYVEESRKGHEKVVEGWRKAVEVAEKANKDGYWPVHVNGKSFAWWVAYFSRCLVLVTSFSYTWAHNNHCTITFGTNTCSVLLGSLHWFLSTVLYWNDSPYFFIYRGWNYYNIIASSSKWCLGSYRCNWEVGGSYYINFWGAYSLTGYVDTRGGDQLLEKGGNRVGCGKIYIVVYQIYVRKWKLESLNAIHPRKRTNFISKRMIDTRT